MGRENRFKSLQTRLNEQTNLCKLRFNCTDVCFMRLSRGLQITHASKLPNILLPMEVHIHNQSSLSLQLLYANSHFAPTKGQLLDN